MKVILLLIRIMKRSYNTLNTCIIGGGNVGHAMATYLGKNDCQVTVFASKYEEFSDELQAIDSLTKESFVAPIHAATNNLELATKDVDIIFITYPSFMIENIFKELNQVLKKKTMIGVIPGTGGAEFFAKDLMARGHSVFGFDRVPCVSRVGEYGKSVNQSKKRSVRIASFSERDTLHICDICTRILGMECLPLKSYLAVTFTPSNPILHTARIYAMFHNYKKGQVYGRNFGFYREWSDKASNMLIGMDDELMSICKSLQDIDLRDVVSVKDHYNAYTIRAMTKKISSIETLKDIQSPMIAVEGGYIPDFSSRYFQEDFPFGLSILKGFALIGDVKTPYMDEVIRWHQRMLDLPFINELGQIVDDKNVITPQKFGLTTKEDIASYYEMKK